MKVLPLRFSRATILAQARRGERAGGLRDRARVLVEILNRGADLIGVDENHLIDMLACELEILLADALDGDAVGKEPDALERHALARFQGVVHRRRILGLDADHAHARREILHVRRDAGDEAATANRHEDRVEIALILAQHLDGNGPLPRDHVRIVERMDEGEIAFAREHRRVVVRLVVIVTLQHDLAAEIHHGLHLDVGRRPGHHDERENAALARSECHALGVIACRRRDHAACGDSRRQMRDLVVRAPQLEGKDRLQVLALQEHLIAEAARQARGGIERRFDRHVVNACLEDSFDVVGRHEGLRKLCTGYAAATVAGFVQG